jgi:L-alanine-DL-glutamate epimerase-like enolase superfamily enzyme
VQLAWRTLELRLAHRWAIARGLRADGLGGSDTCTVVLVELAADDGLIGLGEASPSQRYQENPATVQAFLQRVEARRLTPGDLPGSMRYLETRAAGNAAAKGALNIALADLAARQAGQAIYNHLGLGFTEGKHVTSFSIGIDTPETVHAKVLAAAAYPVLKLKLGSRYDRDNFAALRRAAPNKPLRVDANEAWRTKETALQQIEWLATDGAVQFVEQPLPADADPRDEAWLKARSPLPLMADESYRSAADLNRCVEGFHAVNVKLTKTGGITGAAEALRAARQAGLKTMIGCMIETSVLISAAAHLAELADYLDLDGNLLITNDPYQGASARNGQVSFANAPDPVGLRVRARAARGE